MKIPDMGIIMTAAGVLVILTNALTELFKEIFPKTPAQLTATIIALLLTLCTVFTYTAVLDIKTEWYIAAGAVTAGLFVSYTAQFGYDKLNEILRLIGGKK